MAQGTPWLPGIVGSVVLQTVCVVQLLQTLKAPQDEVHAQSRPCLHTQCRASATSTWR